MTDHIRRHPVLTGAFFVLLAIGVGFGTHAVWHLSSQVIGSGPPRVEGWMTPRHVIRVFNLSRDDLAPILGLAEDETPFASLDDLAAERGLSLAVLLGQVQDAVDTLGAGP